MPPTVLRSEPLVRSACLLLLLAGLGGCASSSLDLAAPRPDLPWTPPVNAQGEIQPKPSQARASSSDFTLPPNILAAKQVPDPQIDARHAYTLPELIDIAQSSNPQTRITWDAARNAALATGIVKSAYLPQLAATALTGWSRSYGSVNTALGTSSSDASLHGNVAALSLQWLLFDFGGKRARVAAAEQATIASNIALTAALQKIVQEVSVAYHAYIAARTRDRNALKAMDNAETILRAARSRYRQGQGTVVEVAQAKQNREQAKLGVVSAQGAQQDAYSTLLAAMGVSPLSRLQVADEADVRLTPKLEAPVEKIIDDALARRPDVLAAYAAEQAEQAKLRATDSEFLPKIFLSASTSYASGGSTLTALPSVGQAAPVVNVSGERSGSNIFLGISIPIYDGGMRSAVRMQAQNDLDSAREKLTWTKQQATRQIVQARNALHSSIAANQAAAELLNAANTTYAAALAAYRHGVGSITDATMAQNQVLAAENAYADSLAQARSAATVLAVATGELASF